LCAEISAAERSVRLLGIICPQLLQNRPRSESMPLKSNMVAVVDATERVPVAS
jgi:hypothetical protein